MAEQPQAQGATKLMAHQLTYQLLGEEVHVFSAASDASISGKLHEITLRAPEEVGNGQGRQDVELVIGYMRVTVKHGAVVTFPYLKQSGKR